MIHIQISVLLGCATLAHGAFFRGTPSMPKLEASSKNPYLELSAGAVHEGAGSLPVFVLDGEKQPLTKKWYTHNFTREEVAECRHAESHGLVHTAAQPCEPHLTIHDFGFYDGMDSQSYLEGGYCVVGVEADPDLASAGLHKFSQWVATGRLTIVNVAVAPSNATGNWTKFYRNKCTKEWNSFYKTTGCRSCTPPHVPTAVGDSCEEVTLMSVTCAQILTQFGIPHYLKLDIEGAETGCFEALSLNKANAQPLPKFISAEIEGVDYLDAMYGLGYTSFKLVRQDWVTTHSSGPWGDGALDCRVGAAWRSYAEVHAEMTQIVAKPFNATDPCPGGLMAVRNGSKIQTVPAKVWYDVHAMLP